MTVLDEAALEDRPEVDLSLLAAPRADPAAPILMALDIGTSGVRAALFNNRGGEIEGSQAVLSSGLHADLGAGGDTDPDLLLDLVTRALDEATARATNFVSRIDYVAASCFWHSLVGIDDHGHAITPLLSWADTRAAAAVVALRSRLDEKEVHSRSGARFHPSYWPAKLWWLRDRHPEVFGRVRQWLSFSDYLQQQLFGEAKTSVSMASATGIFNQRTCDWDPELMKELGICSQQLSPIAVPGETSQGLREEYADRWPLLDRAAWFPAVGDGAANNIGAGCVDQKRVTLMIGTSGAMRAVFAAPSPRSLPSELFCYRADRERLVIGGALSDGGGLYRWMKDSLALSFDDEAIDQELAEIEPDSHGLTILPFWSGERATGWSSSARGAIIGLTAKTRPIEILRAAMEAVCYRFALLARALDAVAPNATIVAAGNALRSSPAWTQMLADVFGRPIESSAAREASCRGAALLALEAIGKIGRLENVSAERESVFEPDMSRHSVYARAIARQQELYLTLVK